MAKHSRILVTGGAGFIGSHIVDRLLAEDFEVVALDNFSSGREENVSHHMHNRRFNLIRGDITNSVHVKQAVSNVDAVFHEAAISNARELDFNLINEINVSGTLNLLKSSLDTNVKHFVFASSAAVYGEVDFAQEDTLPKPLSVYGASKLSAEEYVKVFNRLYGLKTVVLRYFNVYGPRQPLGTKYSAVITSFIKNLTKNNSPAIYGNGKQTRDFIHVEDAVSANMLALSRNKAIGEIFNIASGKSVSINRLAKMLQRIMNREHLPPIHSEPFTGDIKHSKADITKAKSLLGFQSKISLEEGLKRLVHEHTKSENYFV
jgi:nucleoside-diphosphate-sugar epimerase